MPENGVSDALRVSMARPERMEFYCAEPRLHARRTREFAAQIGRDYPRYHVATREPGQSLVAFRFSCATSRLAPGFLIALLLLLRDLLQPLLKCGFALVRAKLARGFDEALSLRPSLLCRFVTILHEWHLLLAI